MTVRELSVRMSSREFSRWEKYQRTVGLPSRRTHLQLALVCLVVAQAMGGASDYTLEDFLVDLMPKPEAPTNSVASGKIAAEAFAGIGGKNVRVLGLKRKRKAKAV